MSSTGSPPKADLRRTPPVATHRGPSGAGTTALLRHWKESVIDVKLALIVLGGTFGGVEVGTMILQGLKGLGPIELAGRAFEWMWLAPMSTFVVLLFAIGTITLIESWRMHRAIAGRGAWGAGSSTACGSAR